MALVKCKECDNEVSNKARKCPNCGAQVKAVQSGCGGCAILIILVLVTFILVSIFSLKDSSNTQSKPPNKPKTAQKPISKQQEAVQDVENADWPFTINNVDIGCYRGHYAVVRAGEGEYKGKIFALNGAASQRFDDLDPIWRIDHTGVLKTKVNVGPFIHLALTYCSDNEVNWGNITFTPSKQYLEKNQKAEEKSKERDRHCADIAKDEKYRVWRNFIKTKVQIRDQVFQDFGNIPSEAIQVGEIVTIPSNGANVPVLSNPSLHVGNYIFHAKGKIKIIARDRDGRSGRVWYKIQTQLGQGFITHSTLHFLNTDKNRGLLLQRLQNLETDRIQEAMVTAEEKYGFNIKELDDNAADNGWLDCYLNE